jgi:uncharacterized protein YfaS (alpha-2-macroglobulin family)
MKRRAALLFSFLFSLSLAAAASESLQVVAKTPSGSTESRRASEAVTATFNRPMVEGREDARALAEQGARGEYWGGFERAENYDDRMQIFADFLTAGEHKYSYLVQATAPGVFHWPAAYVEQMYEPEVFGRTASRPVTIEK